MNDAAGGGDDDEDDDGGGWSWQTNNMHEISTCCYHQTCFRKNAIKSNRKERAMKETAAGLLTLRW